MSAGGTGLGFPPPMQILLITVFMLWPIPSGALTAWQFRGTPTWLSLSLLLSKWVRYLVPTEVQQVSRLLWDLTASENFTGNSL